MAIGLDEPEEEVADRHKRPRIHRALACAHAMAVVVNEVLHHEQPNMHPGIGPDGDALDGGAMDGAMDGATEGAMEGARPRSIVDRFRQWCRWTGGSPANGGRLEMAVPQECLARAKRKETAAMRRMLVMNRC